jgi:DNA-binding MarR family transcriptional regulator
VTVTTTDDGEAITVARRVMEAADRLGRALRAARQPVATRHGLSLLQVLVVEHLAAAEGRRVGALAAELGVTQATVSDAVSSLVAKGVARRHPDPADRRATLVSLTSDGATLAEVIATELEAVTVAGAGDPAAHAVALRVLLSEITRLQLAGVISVNRTCLTCRNYSPERAGVPARCTLLDADLPDRDLRVDCPEHVP